jgi:hypothetical protein
MKKNLHISQTGENWEVEDQSQTLAQAETKAEAIEAAMEVALEREAEQILVHTSDGAVESTIPLKPKPGLD